MTAETKAVADTFDLTLTRVFNAPRPLVFQMWADADHKSQWWRPKVFTLVDSAENFRPGGDWMSIMEAPSGNRYRMEGTYKEIVENELIVFSHHWVEDGQRGPATLITVTFEDDREGTRLTFTQSLIENEADRNDQQNGWNEFLDMLSASLSEAS
ncbi:MAG: SRPBCC domain-containing protein [Parvibaculaceae bacterium]|mgnify:FL=1|nr:SRPBCC domain-containing protein [Parvibaculaceae bacterium]HBM88201.1 SRPBCC domain-containing protein [Rhodobiaceae bacterium]|tara:strand:+ start:225 stop:689 length:465 start_codon:yes stop_codon:yes gene_type:complete